jgi:hypothetical protein
LYFENLYRRLLEIATRRVRSGLVTERGLARLCGLSQPHMHNLLKNIRSFSADSADRLLRALDLDVQHLIWNLPETAGVVRTIPVIRNRLGPGTEASFTSFQGYIPFPLSLVERLVDPVAAYVAADLAMPAVLAPNDLVLLDQNPALRQRPAAGSCWVVAGGTGLRIRRIRVGAARIYLVNETKPDTRNWHSIPLEGRNILEIVRARIVWLGREMQGETPGPEEPPIEMPLH